MEEVPPQPSWHQGGARLKLTKQPLITWHLNRKTTLGLHQSHRQSIVCCCLSASADNQQVEWIRPEGDATPDTGYIPPNARLEVNSSYLIGREMIRTPRWVVHSSMNPHRLLALPMLHAREGLLVKRRWIEWNAAVLQTLPFSLVLTMATKGKRTFNLWPLWSSHQLFTRGRLFETLDVLLSI